ncbi:hypothetical protein [Chondromyces crocatus]|uniref:Cysteinyl-tRNA synthetase n=1 Tax=Chondromyces crocatus TaxID=52 RepID=A0A0K1ED05_CHOCO|nr:hypothetical protein [Chondromyces crocatus]AKT38729.1 uncharacterized protein CMC5_028730 [Chondromyces crocatus]
MTVHQEQDLQFCFDDEAWRILKWDAHHAYVDGFGRLRETKAIDFFGPYLDSRPWLIEVKDFRASRIENKTRLSSGDLAREVAAKVRDTVAGMVWACDRPLLDDGQLRTFVEPLVARAGKVAVVLWLEEDRPASPAAASALAEAIKRELRWLNPKVVVLNRELARTNPIQGLVVTSGPRRPTT